MQAKQFVLFYVDQPQASARFYESLLGRPPVEASPTFAMFAFESGLMFGLWSRDTVEPAPTQQPGAGEFAFPVGSPQDVDRLHQSWQELGVSIAQSPCAMDFGYTFVGLDPDGYRLRVFAPTPG